MLRAVHHPLPYKSATQGTDSRDANAEYGRDVARAMRAGAELRHRAQVVALARREAVEPHAEEAMIQRAERGRGGAGDVGLGDGRLVGDVPDQCKPFSARGRKEFRRPRSVELRATML